MLKFTKDQYNFKFMKLKLPFLLPILLIIGCNYAQKDRDFLSVDMETVKNDYNVYGGNLTTNKVLYNNTIMDMYDGLKEGDTLRVAFMSTVNSVCKAKGCWMKVALGDQKETMVKFKDYSFFVPKDIEKDSVIVSGKAYITEMSVDELRHFAYDEGKTKEEIELITNPERTYSFIADGVLIRK